MASGTTYSDMSTGKSYRVDNSGGHIQTGSYQTTPYGLGSTAQSQQDWYDPIGAAARRLGGLIPTDFSSDNAKDHGRSCEYVKPKNCASGDPPHGGSRLPAAFAATAFLIASSRTLSSLVISAETGQPLLRMRSTKAGTSVPVFSMT